MPNPVSLRSPRPEEVVNDRWQVDPQLGDTLQIDGTEERGYVAARHGDRVLVNLFGGFKTIVLDLSDVSRGEGQWLALPGAGRRVGEA